VSTLGGRVRRFRQRARTEQPADWGELTEDSPGAMVIFWLQMAADPAQFRWAWHVLTPALRLSLAQAWIQTRTPSEQRCLSELAEQLAEGSAPLHEQNAFARVLGRWWAALPPVRERDWAMTRRPRIEAPEVELVLVVPVGAEPSDRAGRRPVDGYVFRLCHDDDGWRIDGVDEQPITIH